MIVDAQISITLTSVSQSVKFEIVTNRGTYPVTLEPSMGILVRASALSPDEFAALEKKLGGMNEASDTFILKDVESVSGITQKVLSFCYVSTVNADVDNGKFNFSGKTQIEDVPLLISVNVDRASGKTTLSVRSENTVLNSRLLKELKKELV